ncbi:MAG: glycoside hydrolase 5 family protein [Eubacteriales bacterium]
MNKTYVKINREKIINDDYVGSCGVYHGFSYMPVPESMGLTGQTREREFKRVSEMKLKVARTWFRPDYSRDMMKRFNCWLEQMQKTGVDVAIQAGWWFTKDVWFFAHEKHNDPVYTKSLDNFMLCCDKFAAWIAKALEYFILVRGYTHIKYLVLFTEPVSYASGPVPEGIEPFKAYEICCRKIHEKLKTYNLRDSIKLMGPNGVFLSHDDIQLKNAVDYMDDIIDIYTLHTYAWTDSSWMKNPDFVMSGYDGWLHHAEYIRGIAAKTGKPVWTDEYGLSGQAERYRDTVWYGNFIAQANAAFINGGLDGSLSGCFLTRNIFRIPQIMIRFITAFIAGEPAICRVTMFRIPKTRVRPGMFYRCFRVICPMAVPGFTAWTSERMSVQPQPNHLPVKLRCL